MADQQDVWVFSEKPSLLAELIAAACTLTAGNGGTVTALVLGARSAADQAIASGADKVLWMGESENGRLVDDYVPTLAKLVGENKPYALLIGSTRAGRAVAGRLSARLGITALTDVLQLQKSGDSLHARHMIFGGGAVRIDQPLASPIIATIGPGTFQAQPPDPGRKGEIRETTWVEPAWRVTLRERKTLPKTSVNLTAARKVVTAGRGIAKEEDLSLVKQLADLLGAEIACTRPLAEGLGWLPKERYIGISGASIKPDLYLGVGVSGQVQHMIGMNHSRVVVAINKDENAPIFEQADYGIKGDLYAVVPAILQALKKRK